MSDWQPRQYLAFADERTRPSRDLLARVPLAAPRLIYDLGCGPGNSTQVLVDTYPQADIIGIDKSPAMLEAARKACPSARFEAGDLAHWVPQGQPDLLFSNAAFQWLPDHLALLKRLLSGLGKNAVLALQMPDNLGEPSHRLMAEAAAPWSIKLNAAMAARAVLPSPQAYYDALKPHCARLDIWHIIYNHPLQGAGAIVEWLKTTGLRPWLDPLDAVEQAAFLAAYEKLVAQAYPAGADGTVLLRFPRLFLVAQI